MFEKNINLRWIILNTLFFLSLKVNLFSEEIWLNDGKIIKGKIVEKNTDTILIKGDDWWKKLKTEDIIKITKDTQEFPISFINQENTVILNENIRKIKESGRRLADVKYWWFVGVVVSGITLTSDNEGSILTGGILLFLISYTIHDQIYNAGKEMENLKLLNESYSNNINTNLSLSRANDNLALYGSLKYKF